jgi:hypothetical protein
MNIHMAKKWPEKVVPRSFIKGHSFPIGLYEELSDIGKATERAVGEALSKSGEFLGCLTDVNGIFRNSRAACL